MLRFTHLVAPQTSLVHKCLLFQSGVACLSLPLLLAPSLQGSVSDFTWGTLESENQQHPIANYRNIFLIISKRSRFLMKLLPDDLSALF